MYFRLSDRILRTLVGLARLPAATAGVVNRLVAFEDEKVAAMLQGLLYPSEEVRQLVMQVIALLAQDRLREAERAVEVYAGKARTATADPGTFAAAIDSGRNGDVLVDLSALGDEDFEHLVGADSLADWMLFLHPDQKVMMDRVYPKAGRLLGVSGSGKTSVLVHRAYRLAKRYPGERILVLGLNATLVRLIRHLLDTLCVPPFREQIEVSTIYDYRYGVVKAVTSNEKLIERIDQKSGETLAQCWADFLDKSHARDTAGPVLDVLEQRADGVDAPAYILDELIWIRSGFGRNQRQEYLAVERPGRGIVLPREGITNVGGFPADTRSRLLRLLANYEEYMEAGGLLDDDGVSLEAFTLAPQIKDHPALRARCVLVDEVQDCSTVELAVIREIPTAETDGLFLTGDPVQKVFAKHSELTRAGIDILGTSTILRKNYRNTRQILEAAFRIIVDFRDRSPVAADDEVLEPEFAYRDGSRPTLYECESREQQRELVLSYLKYYDDEERASTCVCSPSRPSLEEFERALQGAGITTCWLCDDAEAAGLAGGVKLSLLEEVKGFEFRNVFAVDLHDGDVMPKGMAYDERWRIAFQVYVAMTRARDELVMSYVYNPSILLRSLDDYVTEERAATMLG